MFFTRRRGGLVDVSDEELLEIIHKQTAPMQSAEVAQLIYRYTRIIRIKAAKLRNSGIESEDLLQEGFLGLLDAIRSYRCEAGKFAAYADTCITNRMMSAAVKAGKCSLKTPEDFDFEQISDEQACAEDYIILKERNAEFYAKLKSVLSKRELEALWLYLAGFSYNEIAEKLNIGYKSVDNSLSRAKQKLKKRM